MPKESDILIKSGVAADAKGNAAIDAVKQLCPIGCPPPLAKRDDNGKVDIDWRFISDREGGQQLNGYVPALDRSQSGVTVGTGIDLGACSELDIDKLDLDQELKAKLKPYARKQAKNAQNYLKNNPLQLTETEASRLDRAVKAPFIDKLIEEYNAAIDKANMSDGCKRVYFEQLPQSVQTAVASTSFQYGSLSSAAPNYWKQITEQRWQDASDNLNNFGDAYPSRRKLEAGLINAAINTSPMQRSVPTSTAPAGGASILP